MYTTPTADVDATDAMHLCWSFGCGARHCDKRVILLIGSVKIARRQAMLQVQYAANWSNLYNMLHHLMAWTWMMQLLGRAVYHTHG